MKPIHYFSRLLACAVVFGVGAAFAADSKVKFERTEDVIYGRKFGTALTLDVFQPANANGAAILFMVSGGFFSSHEAINAGMYRPLLDRGYTVFAVVHGSQPKFQIPEIIKDVHRATRFVRHNAARWKIDPEKFGVTGGSAGGHLSLILGTQGGPGDPEAKDPVDRASSAVQAVACFYPPTDFRNWGRAGEDGVGYGPTEKYKPAFGPRSDTAEGRDALGQEISPIEFVRPKMPPVLIIHGDSDKVVPLYQAQIFEKRVQAGGSKIKVIVREGADHGWLGMEKDLSLFADWFDQHLREIGKKE
jgi:acetyl esterase/lipase